MDIAVEAVTLRNVEDTISAGGRVSFDDSEVTHVFSPVSGRITRIDARLGQHVTHGATLAVIQAPDIGIASSDLAKAEADEIAARHDLARQRELVAQGAASGRDLEQAEDTFRRAHAERERAAQRVQLLRGGSGDTVTNSYTVRAEIEGEVVGRAANPGMEIQGQYSGGTPFELFTIGNLDRVWVVADVFEMDLDRVHTGSSVRVHVVAYPNRVFAGHVDWISGVLDPTTRTARVRCVFTNADRALRPEMFATVEISVDPVHTLAIPRNALLRLGDSTMVFVQRGPAPGGRIRFERVPVAVDDTIGENYYPVLHGLDDGMQVVSNNAIQLVGML
jgi:cobalt-zinc-cadmium efflux system membrane fusion protein